ncbi:uncharacterized protein K452DRAFT_63460 [Aplosporella prunicola CBS 121167]|uniref:Uncharacterized protein n=1 Tax=Aplosporella prunicola CBS 121167 TaxID=1176127 RepID=A0A6A6B8N4_9PEZI|nr:uncharacterized protein K452DRAFT_63460 [Aplosporella prunicola CBS 121167]KAF2139635.1 hypothetical protein K452DRAFT_63460 [Aplosporella prunicola CBS 121167]
MQKKCKCSSPLGCYAGHEWAMEILLRVGVKLDIIDVYKLTPLREAAYSGHKRVVRRLLKAGAYTELMDNNDCTPAMLAYWKGHIGITRMTLLCTQGAGASHQWSGQDAGQENPTDDQL